MDKPTRIDYDVVKWVGDEFYSMCMYDAATGMSRTEDHSAGDFYADVQCRDGKERHYDVEVKRCLSYFKSSPRLYVENNPKWDTDGMEWVPTGRTWMLNALENDGVSDGKFRRMLGNADSALIYVFKDGWLFFSPRKLRRAYLGDAYYVCSQREEFESEKKVETRQLKAMINLEKGIFIPHPPPAKLMKKKQHEDFNKLNDVCG